MKNIDELLSRFNDIQDLPVSEEMIGAYAEGTLNVSDSQKVETVFSGFADMDDFLSSVGESSEPEELYVTDIDLTGTTPGMGVEAVTIQQ